MSREVGEVLGSQCGKTGVSLCNMVGGTGFVIASENHPSAPETQGGRKHHPGVTQKRRLHVGTILGSKPGNAACSRNNRVESPSYGPAESSFIRDAQAGENAAVNRPNHLRVLDDQAGENRCHVFGPYPWQAENPAGPKGTENGHGCRSEEVSNNKFSFSPKLA